MTTKRKTKQQEPQQLLNPDDLQMSKEELPAFIWSMKYRPRNVDQCILSSALKKTFKKFVKNKQIPNLLLSGRPGIGKSTVAKVLCESIGVQPLWINGSKDAGIDTLRTTIETFASAKPMSGCDYRVVVLDEADYLNAQSVQPALRGFIDTHANNCRFILTANYKHRLLEPLISRFSVVDFVIPPDEQSDMMTTLFNRCTEILGEEDIEYDVKPLANIVKRYFPDFRKTLNELQRIANNYGKIDIGAIGQNTNVQYDSLIKAMKVKHYGDVRSWVAKSDVEPVQFYTEFPTILWKELKPTSLPDAILTLADYQHKSSVAVNQELNTLAAITDIMFSCEWN